MLKNPTLLLNFKTKSLLTAISVGLFSLTLAPSVFAEEVAVKQVQTEANAEFVFKYLAAEVAGQKGELGISTQLFYDLAKSSRDVRLAERAAKVAMYSRNAQAALETAKLWVELDANSTEAQQAAVQIYVINGDFNAAKPPPEAPKRTAVLASAKSLIISLRAFSNLSLGPSVYQAKPKSEPSARFGSERNTR
jgi:hypothetical protein